MASQILHYALASVCVELLLSFLQTPTLHHYSTYSESQLLPCAGRLAWLVSHMATSKQQAVRKKYSSSKFLKVATNSGLHSRPVRELAAADSTS